MSRVTAAAAETTPTTLPPTTSVVGKLFGVAGAVEAMCVRTHHEGVLPPTPDSDSDRNYVSNTRNVQTRV